MQLHSILHDSLPAKFANFQADALQLAVQLRTTEPGSAINIALQEKMKDPEVWCSKLGIPSTSSLRSTIVVLDGTSGDPASIAARASQALPASLSALANVEKQVRTLVTQCCAQPVSHVLRGYPEMQEWTRRDDNAGAEVQTIPIWLLILNDCK
ncbi:unnamed protein product [Polarella glacialis]|uniref:Uncharacterized protein n=1 Tax=Polarella glacialis TaxID=89957 RepID=A0A813GHI2_POLGL|nr:unnamed protein product [Polarella glacialis]CAE8669499.1 unnamed protein product [Polarella glacialis]